MDEKWMNANISCETGLADDSVHGVLRIPTGKSGHAVVAHTRNEGGFVRNDLLLF
jgi:hypothetical protein